MYKALVIALALAAPALATVPLILQSAVTNSAGVSVANAATTTLLAGPAVLGLGLLATVAFASLAREASGRGKRSVNSLSSDSSFAIISNLEPAQCYRRLICDVASGKMTPDSTDEILLAPFAQVNNIVLNNHF